MKIPSNIHYSKKTRIGFVTKQLSLGGFLLLFSSMASAYCDSFRIDNAANGNVRIDYVEICLRQLDRGSPMLNYRMASLNGREKFLNGTMLLRSRYISMIDTID